MSLQVGKGWRAARTSFRYRPALTSKPWDSCFDIIRISLSFAALSCWFLSRLKR